MAALTADRSTQQRESREASYPVAANTTVYAGSLVALNSSGYLVPAGATATLKVVGRAEEQATCGATAGAVRCTVRRGTFRWDNSTAADLIALADVGSDVYAADDQTVAKTSNSNARPIAGRVMDVDSDGVWVRSGY